MRARLPFLRHICREAVHRQNVLQQRAVSALFGIDDRHLRNVLPHRRQTAYSRRRQMHLLPLSARRKQLNRRRLVHAGRRAQRVQPLFHEPNIPRRVQLRIQRLALHGDSAFLRQPFQPLQAEIDRRKEPSVRRGVHVRLDGQRQRSAERRNAQQLRRKRRRNHIKAVHEHILSLEHAGRLEPRAHLPRYILRIGQFARHPLLVGRVDPRNIAELGPRGAFRVHAFGAPRHIGRRQAAALERRDHVGHARREAGRPVLRRAAIHAQLVLLRLDDRAEHHAFAALVEKGLLRHTRQFEDARLKPFRREHVDQKRTADVQPLHDLKLRLQGVLRRHQKHASFSPRHRLAQSIHARGEQPVRPCGQNLHPATLSSPQNCFT